MYKIISSKFQPDFERQVNEMLLDDWMPVGGPYQNGNQICQAMMKIDLDHVQNAIESITRQDKIKP